MRLLRVLHVRGPVADVSAQDDQRGPVFLLLCLVQGPRDGGQVVGLLAQVLHVPMVALEPPGHVVGEGELRLAFDADVVVVVDEDELAQLQMSRDRGGLVRGAFHQIAVAANGVGVVVDDVVSRAG